MKTRLVMLMIAALAVALPAAAQVQLFDFLGQALVPTGVGGTLTMYSVMTDPAPAETPLPLDFDTYQYTLVIADLVLDVDGSPQNYSGGSITIFEDAATAADYALPGTFFDGTAILSGTFVFLDRTMFTATLGSAMGEVDWTGGTRLTEMAPADRLGWPFFTGINARADQVVDGYDEAWDGKVEPYEPIVADEVRTWSDVKRLW